MKTLTFVGIISLVLLTSCGSQKSNNANGVKVPDSNYPTTQVETPATKYCTSQGGTASVEKEGTGGVEIAYCTLSGGIKVDAWKYMSEGTAKIEAGTGN